MNRFGRCEMEKDRMWLGKRVKRVKKWEVERRMEVKVERWRKEKKCMTDEVIYRAEITKRNMKKNKKKK